MNAPNGFRNVGSRKQILIDKMNECFQVLHSVGINGRAVLKHLKIKTPVPQKYTTKQLTGVLGRIKEFCNDQL